MTRSLHVVSARYPNAAPTVSTTVVLADDHQRMRRSIRSLLQQTPGVEILSETGDPDAVFNHVGRDRPDVLILDLQMLGEYSCELIRRMRVDSPETEIVVLTMEARTQFAQRALDAGAVGYVLKEHAHEELAVAIQRARRGARFVSAQVDAGLRFYGDQPGHDGLTRRELDVLTLTALGYTGAELSKRLNISIRTVESHRAAINHKLAIRTRAELVGYALRRGLLTTSAAPSTESAPTGISADTSVPSESELTDTVPPAR